MNPNVLILIHNGGLIFSGGIALIIGIFVLTRGISSIPNRIYFLTNILYTIYATVFLLGTNTADPNLSKFYFMFTLVNLFTVTTNAHFVWSLISVNEKIKHLIKPLYAIATVLFLFFAFNPSQFLLPSKKYLYLQNYFNPGPLYFVFVIFFGAVAVLFLGTTFVYWLRAKGNEKTRITYILVGFLWAYVTGSIGFLPLFGIDADPLYAAFVGLYTIPIAYCILTYKLLDLHLIARRAIKFSLFTVLAGLLIVLANYVGNYASNNIAGFPSWPVPLLSGLLVVIIGFVVMRRLREVDALKYEFINNISHKFRTPLTHIRWLSEELRDESNQEIRDRYVEQIQYASMRLFELTNIVIDVAEDAEIDYPFRSTLFSLLEVTKNLVQTHDDQLKKKHLSVQISGGENIPQINADKTRLQFVMQIIFENAIIYTPQNGKIEIKIHFNNEKKEFIFSVSDSGIGINSNDLPKLFSKFYRTVSARHTDTEGMGIGLYMAKKIIINHNGRIWAESDGEGNGSTFFFAIPLKS